MTLGCARNEVDSEELAGRLEAGGFELVDDADGRRRRGGQHLRLRRGGEEGLGRHAARRPPTSRQAGRTQAVVAVGCLAERYGKELAESLPEADAVLGFDDYPDIAARLRSILAGEAHHPHTPQDRRGCCRSPRPTATPSTVPVPGHAADRRASAPAPRPPARAPYAAGSTAARWPR